MYFKNFGKIVYPIEVNGIKKNVLLTDITKNIRFIQRTLSSIKLFDNYSIKDGETPEIISDLFYGTPEYHWIIMLSNDRYDYINDFPMSQYQLDLMIAETYGEDADSPAYYSKNGLVVDSGTIGAVVVTNRLHENIVNERKRNIKIIPKDYIGTIVKDFVKSING